MSILLLAFVAFISVDNPEQWTQSCQTSNPRLERLASAIRRGEVREVGVELDAGLDVNETWRDSPAEVCSSLLLRSIFYSQDEIFDALLKRGADPRSLPGESLAVPVRNGRVEMVRRLLALGLKPHDNNDVVREGLASGNLAMLDLLASAGVRIDASSVPSWALTDDVTRHLVPKYLRPNDRIAVGN